MKGWIVAAILFAVGVSFAFYVVGNLLVHEYLRFPGPNGYQVVVTKPKWAKTVSVTPGQAGDLPGFIEIFTKDGKSCGRVRVEMVSFARDLEWNDHSAEIRLVAVWNLKNRTAKKLQN